MRRLSMILLLVMVATVTSGCWFGFAMDAEHNRGHWEIIKTDLQEWHSDLDFLLGLDEPTLLETHYR